jgi:anti-sigma factor RsiW
MNKLRTRARQRRDHRWAPRHMSDYLDGELGARRRQRLDNHVRECDECRHLLAGLRQMLGRLRDLASPAARPDPEAMAARVRDRLRQQG